MASVVPCYHPLRAYQRKAGAPLFFGNAYPTPGGRYVPVKCGRCIGCRLEESRQTAVRCVHEAQMHDVNCFLTLTYRDDNLPMGLVLVHRHFELFLKCLRERLRRDSRPPIRYLMCGEYGDINSRPHYHCLLFGFYPDDAVYYRTSKTANRVYTSKFLDSVWELGNVYIGNVSFESAGYIARYSMKKVFSDDCPMREILDVTTGEIVYRPHEYSHRSLKPGLGATWFAKYFNDLYPRDFVRVEGRKQKIPRYYDVLLDRCNPVYLAGLKDLRSSRLKERIDKLIEECETPFGDAQRLDVHEVVKKAQLNFLKRG